jgi:AcrR family transcriptional regulator
MSSPVGEVPTRHDHSPAASGHRRPQKPFGTERTRRDILRAAGRRFARAGYASVRLKDIATDVGVTAPLVLRYFGSKEALFREVARDERNPPHVTADLRGPLSSLGERLARTMTHYWLSADFHYPAIALIRSLDFEESKALFNGELARRLTDPLCAVLPGPDPQLRAQVISSQLMGIGMFGLGILTDPDTPPPAPEEIERMVQLLGRAVQAIIDSP